MYLIDQEESEQLGMSVAARGYAAPARAQLGESCDTVGDFVRVCTEHCSGCGDGTGVMAVYQCNGQSLDFYALECWPECSSRCELDAPPPPPPPTCTGGKVLVNGGCQCPTGQTWDGSRCAAPTPFPTPCPATATGQYRNASGVCVCPPATPLNAAGTACVAGSPPPTPGSCTCTTGQYAGKACPGGTQAGCTPGSQPAPPSQTNLILGIVGVAAVVGIALAITSTSKKKLIAIG